MLIDVSTNSVSDQFVSKVKKKIKCEREISMPRKHHSNNESYTELADGDFSNSDSSIVDSEHNSQTGGSSGESESEDSPNDKPSQTESKINESSPLLENRNRIHQNSPYHFFIYWLANDLFFINALARRFSFLKSTSDFSDGVSFAAHKFWTPTFLGFLTHDLIQYQLRPNDRYGVTISQILTGTADNQYSLSSHLGSDLPADWKYFLGAALIYSVVLTSGGIQVIRGCYERNRFDSVTQIPDQQSSLSNRLLTSLPRLIARPISLYQDWSARKPVAWYLHPPFWFAVLFSLYADVRLVEIMVNKIKGWKKYSEEKNQCEPNKKFLFLPEYGNYECVACDWDFVEPRDRFDADKCFSGLLNGNNSPEFILENINSLLRQHLLNTSLLDFSRQNWHQWLDAQWEKFFSNPLLSNHDWTALNLSSSQFNPSFLSTKRMAVLADFLNQSNVSQLDIHNQGVGDAAISQLSSMISQLQYLDVSSNQLTKTDFLINATKSLKTLKIANNKLGDQEIQKIFQWIPFFDLTELDISHTNINEDGLDYLSDVLPNSQLQKIDVSENDFSQADFNQFGQAIALSSVKELHLSKTQMIDDQAVQLAEASAHHLNSLDVSQNPISDQGVISIISSGMNGNLSSVDFSGTSLTQAGIQQIANILQDNINNVSEIKLANTQMTAQGFSAIVDLPQLTALDVSNNAIGDEATKILNEKKSHIFLEKINLSATKLSDEGALQLAEALPELNVSSLDISHNQVSSASFAKIVQSNTSSLTDLNVANNQITEEGAQALALALPKKPIETIHLENNPLTEMGSEVIAKSLIKPPTPHFEEIGKEIISVDEARALRRSTKPATKMKTIYLDFNLFQGKARRAFRRVLPSAPDTDVKIYALQNQSIRQNNFFGSQSLSPFIESNVRNTTQMNANTAPYLLISLASGIGTIIIGLIALYLIYRALKNSFSNQKNIDENKVVKSYKN